MEVNLVSITHPSINNLETPEDLIAYCARVSNPTNQLNTATAPKLLGYLIKHKHWSPFEMVDMCLEIKTSRAIAAQILRHRSFSFQEFSQRYSNVTNFEDIEWRKQGKTNRQVGDEVYNLPNDYNDAIDSYLYTADLLYKSLIKDGVAKECARMILPLTTETTMYMKGSIRSWIHYIDLRSKEDTQKEHRDIALKCRDIFVNNFPNTSTALQWTQSQ
jgi:thymidylate synthase (FAD)